MILDFKKALRNEFTRPVLLPHFPELNIDIVDIIVNYLSTSDLRMLITTRPICKGKRKFDEQEESKEEKESNEKAVENLLLKTKTFLQHVEQDLEIEDISIICNLLASTKSCISGSYLLSFLDEKNQDNGWQSGDIDFFCLDNQCDQDTMTSPIDDFFKRYNFVYSVTESKKVENKNILDVLSRYVRYDENEDGKVNIFNHYSGPTKKGMTEEGGYFGADVAYRENIVIKRENVCAISDSKNYVDIEGIVATRKYHLKKKSIDIVYIDSTKYNSVYDFIKEKFDFDFLKNTFDGRSIQSMKPSSIISHKSNYHPPRFITTGRNGNAWISEKHYLAESINKGISKISELEKKRRALYESRGFKTTKQ
jgi:hypothetical protein